VRGHDGTAIVQFGLIGIVQLAHQADVGLAVITALPERDDVVELEPLARGAAPSLQVAEGALSAVARPDQAPDWVGNMPRRW